jgi:hypothetical protein
MKLITQYQLEIEWSNHKFHFTIISDHSKYVNIYGCIKEEDIIYVLSLKWQIDTERRRFIKDLKITDRFTPEIELVTKLCT